MLDEFKVGLPSGFSDHPHRGFSTLTFMLPDGDPDALLEHEDFNGHRGVLGLGGVQYMTAGRGIVHAEVPTSVKKAHGLQLWINLSAKDKFMKPSWQDQSYLETPKSDGSNGIVASVVAGTCLGVTSLVVPPTPVHYVFLVLQPDSDL